MGITDFVDYVQALTPYKVYPLNFPSTTDNVEAVIVKFEPSSRTNRGGLVQANLQMIIRANHPKDAEAEANNLLKHFDNKTRFNIGGFKVVLATARQPFSMFLEKDDLDRYKYNVNINLLIDK